MSRTARTRAHIQQTALDLFEQQGFEATTVAEVAAAAGVSHMTVFRHFATKEALVVEDLFDAAIGDAVAAQPTDLPPLRRAVAGFRSALDGLDADASAEVRRRVRIVALTPSLRAASAAASTASQGAVAAALTDGDAAPLDAQVAAAAVVAGLGEALLAWALTDDDLREHLDRALDVLDGAR